MADETVESYVLRHWKHFSPAGMGWESPHKAIESYETNPTAFYRDKVEVERRIHEEAESTERVLRDSMSDETRAIYAEIRALVEDGLSEQEIAQRTGYRLAGVANAVRWFRNAPTRPDPLVEGLVGDVAQPKEDAMTTASNGQATNGVYAEQLMPHDIEAEEAVVGALLIDGESFTRVSDLLRSEDFYRESNRACFAACSDLFQRSEAIDQVTLARELARTGLIDAVGGMAYLSHLVSITPTSAHAEHYAVIIARTATMRRLIVAASQISALGYADTGDVQATLRQAEETLLSVYRGQAEGGFVSLKRGIDRFLAEWGKPHCRAGHRRPPGLDRPFRPGRTAGRTAPVGAGDPGRPPRDGQDGAGHDGRHVRCPGRPPGGHLLHGDEPEGPDLADGSRRIGGGPAPAQPGAVQPAAGGPDRRGGGRTVRTARLDRRDLDPGDPGDAKQGPPAFHGARLDLVIVDYLQLCREVIGEGPGEPDHGDQRDLPVLKALAGEWGCPLIACSS